MVLGENDMALRPRLLHGIVVAVKAMALAFEASTPSVLITLGAALSAISASQVRVKKDLP